MMDINCVIQTSFFVGLIASVVGIFTAYILEVKKLSLEKLFKIFLVSFLTGIVVHILLEYFNFNQICFDKKCYSIMCH